MRKYIRARYEDWLEHGGETTVTDLIQRAMREPDPERRLNVAKVARARGRRNLRLAREDAA